MKTSELLASFLSDAKSGQLKTSQYPKDFLGLKMKVSFGMGAVARVPWMSFFTPEMTTSNGFYPVYLYYKDAGKLVLSFGVSESNDFGKSWDADIVSSYPFVGEVISNPPRYGDSWAFKVYTIVSDESIEIKDDSGHVIPEQELEHDLAEIINLFHKNLETKLQDKTSPIGAGLFYMEKQLEDFIISNWEITSLGQDLELLFEDGVLVSQQFRTSIGPIDILARDKKSGDYVVIELKRNQTSDDTIGQVMRYMGWVAENLSNPGVRGVIVAGKFDAKLQYAQKMMPSIDVFIYEVSFALKEHVQ